MPAGTKDKVDIIVDNSTFYRNKHVWKQKFYYLCDYITAQNINTEIDTDADYVNINEEITAKILGVNNQEIATMLRNSVAADLFKKDGIVIRATKTKIDNKTVYLTEGKSCGYQFNDWNYLEEVTVSESRSSSNKTISKAQRFLLSYDKNLKLYHETLKFIKLDESKPEKIILEILSANQKKKSQKENYDRFMKLYKRNLHKRNPNKHTIPYILPLDGAFVPIQNDANLKAVLSYLNTFRYGAFVPGQFFDTVLSYPGNFKDGKFVPDETKKPIEMNSHEVIDAIIRYRRSINVINGERIFSSRPNRKSRVYNDITSLKRELRKMILFDGKKVIGLDIANSQPLIAYILIKDYWLKKLQIDSGQQGSMSILPQDVEQYRADCETGMFYNNFMRQLNLPDHLRRQFKNDFFAKVFFSEHKIWKDPLKDLFMEKYPSCWEAICKLKGGLNSKKYNQFSIMLQEKEAKIMFDTVNIQLINLGIKAFNIFDSIYVNNMKDYDTARKITLEAFKAYGLHPTITPEYIEEDNNENERKAPLEAQHQDGNPRTATNQDEDRLVVNDTINTPTAARYHDNDSDATINIKPRKIKEEEMKKIYTVDELLSKKSKENTPVKPVEVPTKLQHLKRPVNEKETEKNIDTKSQEEPNDISNEPVKEKSKKFTDKEIYDIVVAELKSNGEKVSKENVEYLIKVFKEELENRNKPKEAQPTYTFVNPYVKH